MWCKSNNMASLGWSCVCLAVAILCQDSGASNVTLTSNQSATAGSENGTSVRARIAQKADLTYDFMLDMAQEFLQLLDVFGIIPHSFTTKGFHFTYLLPSWREMLGLVIAYEEDTNYVYTSLFNRLLIGYYTPENLGMEKSIQSLVGTVYSVRKIRNDTVRVGHMLVNTTRPIFVFDFCVIYVDTAIEPK